MRRFRFKLTKDKPSRTIKLKDGEQFFLVRSKQKDMLVRYIKDSDNLDDDYRKIVLEKKDDDEYIVIEVLTKP